jgi:hypothetical protein
MAAPFVQLPLQKPIIWLSLARHHGRPTRLLDWTLSPLVAAFFAASSESDVQDDFAVYAYESNYYEESIEIDDPFLVKEAYVEVHVDHYSERMAAQRGFFTLHRKPDRPFRVRSLIKFVFPSKTRSDTLCVLDFYGVNKSSLFPGLDGIAEYWKWFYKIGEGFE